MSVSLRRYAVASIVAALVTIVLKGAAYSLTGSVAILSDALESVVNLVAAGIALIALSVAARPADEDHAYGHTKAEYFSSGFEGALILVAAISITWAAVRRLMDPMPLEEVGIGLALTLIASAVNLAVARALMNASRRHESIVLEADAHHLMTDVWTSVAVVVGVAITAYTGWQRLDPIVAILVAANIMRTGFDLLRRSLLGLLDTAIPETSRSRIVGVLESFRSEGVHFHALRTRQAGRRRFVSVHILVPGHWSVQSGHDLLERVEEQIRGVIPGSIVFTHLEPLEDPMSFADVQLDRGADDPSAQRRIH